MSVPSRPVVAAWVSCRDRVKTVVLMPRRRSTPGLGVAGQPEDALPDDVALHLARAPGDGQTPGGQEPLAPAPCVVLRGGAQGSEQHEPELLHPLFVFR